MAVAASEQDASERAELERAIAASAREAAFHAYVLASAMRAQPGSRPPAPPGDDEEELALALSESAALAQPSPCPPALPPETNPLPPVVLDLPSPSRTTTETAALMECSVCFENLCSEPCAVFFRAGRCAAVPRVPATVPPPVPPPDLTRRRRVGAGASVGTRCTGGVRTSCRRASAHSAAPPSRPSSRSPPWRLSRTRGGAASTSRAAGGCRRTR